jgi:iron complex outermembrane receptor protein
VAAPFRRGFSGMSRPRLIAILVLAPAMLAGAAAAQSTPGPARPVESALLSLCRQWRCGFVVEGEAARARLAGPPREATSLDQALDVMFRDSGLAWRLTGPRSIRVWAEPRPTARAVLPETAAAPPPTTVAAIEVQGAISAGVDAALAEKRAAVRILDGVTAVRIGELPAANLAEALQRIPGVAIEREVGEGQFVSVRGLGPLFQSVTLNGAPVAFNENLRNSTQSGRQFRFRALSVDLFAGAVLTKSASAELVDGGIGSNIDIRTVRGLDGPAYLAAEVVARGEARAAGLHPELTISGRWRTDRLGLVAGLSRESREVQFDRLQTQRYRTLMVEGRPVAVPNDFRTTIEREARDRLSLFAGAEWRPSDRLAVTLDALASRFGNAIREDRLAYELGDRVLAPSTRDLRIRDGVLVGASLTGGRLSNNLEMSDQRHDNISVSLAADALLGDWRVRPRLTWSRALSTLDLPLQRIAAVTREDAAYAFDLGADPMGRRRIDRLETDYDLDDPAALTFSRYGVRATAVDDDDLTAMLSVGRPLDGGAGPVQLRGLELGLQATGRHRDYQRRDREASLRPGLVIGPDFYGARTPEAAFATLIARRDGARAAADFARFAAAFHLGPEYDGVDPAAADLAPTGADRQSSYTVDERLGALYGRLDLDGEIAGRPWRGDVGLRLVGGRSAVVGSILGVSAGGELEVRPLQSRRETLNLLPSANLVVDLDAQTLLRAAVSRSLTRPSLADLGAATIPASSLVFALYTRGEAELNDPGPNTIFTGVGGNPDLKPYVATNLDLSLERYFAGFGAVTLAAFHKDIEDYVMVVDRPERLTFQTRAGPPVTAEVLMSRPRNIGRARITGAELGFSARHASGLGLWASATVNDASSRAADGGRDQSLQGVSRYSWSVSPFVERGPLEAHLSWTWRSAFRSVADLQGGGVEAFVVGDAGVLDAAATWRIAPGAVLVLQGSNLTDTVDVAWDGSPERPLQISRAGRSVAVGLRLRL